VNREPDDDEVREIRLHHLRVLENGEIVELVILGSVSDFRQVFWTLKKRKARQKDLLLSAWIF